MYFSPTLHSCSHTHCQMSVLILFHCIIHASLFPFLCFLLVCLINLKKNQKNQLQLLASLLSMPVVVVTKKKTQKDFSFFFCLLGAFLCKQFYFFSFLWGSIGENHDYIVEVTLICINIDLTKEPILPCLLLFIECLQIPAQSNAGALLLLSTSFGHASERQ